MLKYSNYIKEEIDLKSKFAVGEEVRFKSLSPHNSIHNNKICKIEVAYPYTKRYMVKIKGVPNFMVNEQELESVKEKEKENKVEKNKFEIGDRVIFKSAPGRYYYKRHDDEICKINHIYSLSHPFEYQIITNGGSIITASENELRFENEPSKNYIENQFEPKNKLVIDKNGPKTDTVNNNFSIGQRVIVNGKEGRFDIIDRKGTIKRVSSSSCLVEFDEDESKNQSNFAMMVDKKIITPIDEISNIKKNNIKRDYLIIGDIVKCIDSTSQFFNLEGEVTNVWPDKDAMIEFKNDNNTVTGKVMKGDKVEVIKPKSFINNPTKSTTSTPVKDNSIEEEEDEDDNDGVVTVTKKDIIKKGDLLELSFRDFFLEEKISTKEDCIKNKEKYENILKDKSSNEFKLIIYEKSLKIAELIEQYFDFLIAKIANGLPVYRTLEDIDDNKDILITKTKVRASESKEITKKYSFDQGIIAYWKFKDAVIFKTI